MKLNILKFQGGGTGLGSLFSAVQVAAPSTTPTDNTDDSDKASDAILSESTLNKLRSLEYGLPNELDRFEIELAALELKLNSGRRVSPREIADIRAKAGRLIAQAGHLKNAEQNAEKNGFLDDVAIDYRGVGYIYAITEKGIDKVSFQQYNPEKHQALTYSELIEYRRQSPQLINNAEVIASINKGVGLEKVNSFITDILKIVNDSSSKQEAYTSLKAMYGKDAVGQLSTLDYAAIKDIAQMVEHVGLDTIFKTTNISNDANLQHAFKYIASILPKNMQALLEASYIVNGGSYKDAKTYVGNVIGFATLIRAKDEYEIDYPKEFNTAMGTKAGAKSDPDDPSKKSYYQNPIESLFTGDLNKTTVTLSDPASNNQYGIEVSAVLGGPLTVLNGTTPVRDMPMHIAIELSVSPMLDNSKVYVGEQKTPMEKLQNIIYTNADTQVVYMPADSEGNIAWDAIQAYSQAEKQCQQENITDPKTKNIKHAALGSCIRYTADGKQTIANGYKLQAYFKTHGYTNDDFFPGFWKTGNPVWSTELRGAEEDAVRDRIKNIESKTNRKAGNFDKIGLNWHDAIFRVPVYIKVDANAETNARMYSGHGPLEPGRSNSTFIQAQQALIIPNTNPELLNL